MTSFRFEAFDSNGRKRHGEIESSTRESAFAKLERTGMRNIEIEIEDEAIELEADVEVDVVQHDREIEIGLGLEPDELFDPIDPPETKKRHVSFSHLKGGAKYEMKYRSLFITSWILKVVAIVLFFAEVFFLTVVVARPEIKSFRDSVLVALVFFVFFGVVFLKAVLLAALADLVRGSAVLFASSERSADVSHASHLRLENIERRLSEIG